MCIGHTFRRHNVQYLMPINIFTCPQSNMNKTTGGPSLIKFCSHKILIQVRYLRTHRSSFNVIARAIGKQTNRNRKMKKKRIKRRNKQQARRSACNINRCMYTHRHIHTPTSDADER